MRRILLAAVMFGAASGAEAGDLLDLPILRGAFTDGLNSRPANWQGAYVGVQGGYGTSNMNFSGSTRTIAASLLSGTEMENQQQISSWPIMGKVSVHGSGWGGFAGYNSQWDDVVVGFEASYLHGSFGGSQTDSMSRFFSLPSGSTNSATYQGTSAITISDMASLRVRAGYAWGAFLPYAFGGVALGQANITRTARIFGTQVNAANPPPFDNVPFDVSATEANNSKLIYGYSFGLGVDVQLVSNLFFRAEWEYSRFATVIDTNVSTGRLGLGYKF
ncbi:outer membrane protein [Bradyrhizobium sp.]|uniref:outer membrane protein n=1 Tax=Bradyrhizobium sp. TaxID=376 RepID=UPI0027358BC0|nr:outer membrane beta-barrel protein [Bradyrhizobium sp.]MDP3690539.1 outer membrane beta-barrel protein [Bradyrhizobium sp.]